MSSTTTIRFRFKVGGVLTDADSVLLADQDDVYGVKRADTNAVVVAAGEEMDRVSLGVYSYTFDDPASGLDYTYFVRAVRGARTISVQKSIRGGRGGNLYDLIPRIVPWVAGCPIPVIKQALRGSARDFFKETGLWREDLAIDSVEDEQDYDLSAAHNHNADIKRVREVKLEESRVRYAVNHLTDVLRLEAAPNADDLAIVASVTLQPWENNDTYPARILSTHDEGIVQGALMSLYAMPGKPWTSPANFQLAERKFTGACGDGRRETIDNRGPGLQRIRGRRFK